MKRLGILSGLCFLTLLGCGRGTDNSRGNGSKTTGDVDEVFTDNFGAGLSGSVMSLVSAGNSKIWVGGDFKKYKNLTAQRLTRLSNDGRIDEALRNNVSIGFDGGTVRAMARQSNGAIVVGGDFTSYKGTAVSRLARISSDGALDTTFNSNMNGGPNNSVYSIAIDGSGNIFLGGTFTSLGSSGSVGVAKLYSNGIVDTTFSSLTAGGASGEVYTLALLPSSKILVGGKFTTFGGVAARNIVRLNINGSLDSTYLSTAASAFNDAVYSCAFDGASNWLLGGSFSSFSTYSLIRFARLLPSGAANNDSDIPGGGFNGTVRSILVQGDGRILVGGDFTALGTTNRPRLVRLNTDLTVDETFHTALGDGPNGNVHALAFDSDGGLFVGGSFSAFDGTSVGNLIRLK